MDDPKETMLSPFEGKLWLIVVLLLIKTIQSKICHDSAECSNFLLERPVASYCRGVGKVGKCQTCPDKTPEDGLRDLKGNKCCTPAFGRQKRHVNVDVKVLVENECCCPPSPCPPAAVTTTIPTTTHNDSTRIKGPRTQRTTTRIKGPITDDFSDWLDNNGYSDFKKHFRRHDLGAYGSYGGRATPNQPITKNPVVFVHGNSDKALNAHDIPGLTGWTKSIEYFQSKGYTSAELYATTWGPANLLKAKLQVHSCAYLEVLRAFTEAVVKYTGASKISMVSHSMGVTLARGVVKGGVHSDESGESCNLGPPLTDKVDTFIGIAGGNRGLALCFQPPYSLAKSCNKVNGFYPGFCMLGFCKGNVHGMTKYLAELNNARRHEGQHIYSIWSRADLVVGYTNLVWGYPTSRILHQDDEKVFLTYGHIQCKDKTSDLQYTMINEHRVD